jgi:hypothetical protein
MKKRDRIITLIALTFSISGCEQFLEDIDPPKSQISSQVIFTNDVMATSAVIGIYLDMLNHNSFASGSNASITALAGLSADELNELPGTDNNAIEFEQNELGKENVHVYGLWQSLFKSIYAANAILEGLNTSSGLTASVKAQLVGEALFVRAFCNFYLVNLFGDTPLITTTDYLTNAKVSRTSMETMQSKIVDDLLAATASLSAEYVNRDAFSSEERVRPNKFTAIALLARVYLYQGNWQKAEEYSTQIIDNTTHYELKSDLNEVFLMNSREAIWQLAPVAPNFNTHEGYFFVGLPSEYNVLKDDVVSGFEPLDKRKAEWVGTNGTINFPHKYKQYTSTPNVTEYSMVFRLAEQYLIRAEARAQQDNVTGTNSAASDINTIRHRAGLPNTLATTKTEMLAAAEQERRVELFTEWGHRWFDLKRWDRTDEVLGPKKPRWSDTDKLYPVPQLEINKNTKLLPQNPGY